MNSTETISPEFIDIVVAADSITLMGEERGFETWRVLQPKLESLTSKGGAILDMSKISMLDYKFSQTAFGPLFDSTVALASFNHVLFLLPRSARNSFFEGILKSNGHPTMSFSESEQMFVKAGLHCKLVSTDSASIDFVGGCTQDEERVLSVVNELRHGRLEHLVEQSGMRYEDVHDNLRSLERKGFVIEQQKTDVVLYLSYYQLINHMEASNEQHPSHE